MSNTMKKLKLLHHLTAASSTTTSSHPPSSCASAQQAQNHHQFFFNPASPVVSPQTTPGIRHYYQSPTTRAALHSLQPYGNNNNPQQTYSPPPPPPPQQPQCLLPGGFMVLTPVIHDNTSHPGLSVPATPPPHARAMAVQPNGSPVPRGNPTIYSPRPPMSSHHHHYTATSTTRQKPLPRLTREAVSKIGKDSRLARWERVLGYVRDQTSSTPPTTKSGAASTSPASSLDSSVSSGSARASERRRRLSELAAIEAQNAIIDALDREEQDLRSLWSGGSGGTNGVDEFVWSEDEDDDILPMPQGPPPVKIHPVVEQEGVFEMEDQAGQMATKRTFERRWTGVGIGSGWNGCRDGDLEGGLARVLGRRMSAAY